MGKQIASSEAITAAFQPRSKYDLIAFASSAGGVQALTRILPMLPRTLTVPIVVVMHRTPRKPEMLPAILTRASSLPVKLAEEGDSLQPSHIYVAPSDAHLVLLPNQALHLTDGARIKFVLSSANPLLESAARVLKSRVIAVVLTGTGSDGTDGVQAVRDVGGIVIAQDPREAEHPGMPAAAIRSGAVDYVVSLDEIAPLLVRLTTERPMAESEAVVQP